MENNAPKTAPEQAAGESQDLDIVAKAKSNGKLIVICSIVLLACIAGVLIWFFVAKNGAANASEAVGKADIAAATGNDSTALVLYQEAATHGYKGGNRAKLEVAIRLYQDGKYQEALDYLKDASIDDKIVAAGALTLEGDCYVNLEKYDDALSAYKKAVKKADENPQIVPVILIKEANIYRAQNNYKEEAAALKQIVDNYPQFGQTSQTDVQKLYERAKASAAE